MAELGGISNHIQLADKMLFLDIKPHASLYSNYVLNIKSDINDGIGVPDWRLSLCLLFSWTVIFLVLAKGVKSSGKVLCFSIHLWVIANDNDTVKSRYIYTVVFFLMSAT